MNARSVRAGTNCRILARILVPREIVGCEKRNDEEIARVHRRESFERGSGAFVFFPAGKSRCSGEWNAGKARGEKVALGAIKTRRPTALSVTDRAERCRERGIREFRAATFATTTNRDLHGGERNVGHLHRHFSEAISAEGTARATFGKTRTACEFREENRSARYIGAREENASGARG